LTFPTIALADRRGPETNARLTRSLLVMTFTCEPPMSMVRTVLGERFAFFMARQQNTMISND
jgi:hypothetical protein